MIARSTVTFAALRQLLLDLGFTPSKRGKFWFFDHPSSGTVLGYRPYRTREKSTLVDLHMTRKHLDWRSVLYSEAFDDRLKVAPAERDSSWIARRAVTFGELRQLLLDLGFTVSKRGRFWFFEHPLPETWFAYRTYRLCDNVTAGDLHMTRKHLDWRVVLREKAFDERLK